MGYSKQQLSTLDIKITNAHKAGEACKKMTKVLMMLVSFVLRNGSRYVKVKLIPGRSTKRSERDAHRTNLNPCLHKTTGEMCQSLEWWCVFRLCRNCYMKK